MSSQTDNFYNIMTIRVVKGQRTKTESWNIFSLIFNKIAFSPFTSANHDKIVTQSIFQFQSNRKNLTEIDQNKVNPTEQE